MVGAGILVLQDRVGLVQRFQLLIRLFPAGALLHLVEVVGMDLLHLEQVGPSDLVRRGIPRDAQDLIGALGAHGATATSLWMR